MSFLIFEQFLSGKYPAPGICHMEMDPIVGKPAFTGRITIVGLMRKKKERFIFVNVQVFSVLIYMKSSPAHYNENAGVYAPPLMQETAVTDQIAAGEKLCGLRCVGCIV